MNLQELNALPPNEARKLLLTCCGSLHWVDALMQSFPFTNDQHLFARATAIWYDVCAAVDYREAFNHHPKIGDLESLQKKFSATQHLTVTEQSNVRSASREVITLLAAGNTAYEEKFGFIFIVCATGKSAGEMLHLLSERLQNTCEEEMRIAMGEQHKITIIRLKKLVEVSSENMLQHSYITTHILDTSIGKPAKGITIKLQDKKANTWQTFAQGVTDADGRISDLLPPGRKLQDGHYKIIFDIASYFKALHIESFYPEVEVQFTTAGAPHYHVPLLINPFGYSTYRGS